MERSRARSTRSKTPVSDPSKESVNTQARTKRKVVKPAVPKILSKIEEMNNESETQDLKSNNSTTTTTVVNFSNKEELSTNKKLTPSPNKKRQTKTQTDSSIKTEKVAKMELKPKILTNKKLTPSPKNKRQTKTSTDPSIKTEKVAKMEPKLKTPKNKLESETFDIEEGGWKPENWREVLDNILTMRKLYIAPIDTLGCEECPEEGVLPKIERYQSLISVMLSSQTRDEVTYAAMQRLIDHGCTVDNILKTPDERIGELIYPAGFWKTKIKYIKNTTQILKDKYNGDIPRTYDELIKLPGVGPKMAHLVMSCAWKDTVGIAVDTHVHRISNRLGWVPKPTKTPEQTRKALESWLPKDLWKPINFDLVGFGQTICKPIGPSCNICLNKNLCPFGQASLSAKNKGKSKK